MRCLHACLSVGVIIGRPPPLINNCTGPRGLSGLFPRQPFKTPPNAPSSARCVDQWPLIIPFVRPTINGRSNNGGGHRSPPRVLDGSRQQQVRCWREAAHQSSQEKPIEPTRQMAAATGRLPGRAVWPSIIQTLVRHRPAPFSRCGTY